MIWFKLLPGNCPSMTTPCPCKLLLITNCCRFFLSFYFVNTVKPLLRGHLCDKEKVAFQKRFNSYEIFYDGTRKGCPFNTGDCLIEVTSWAGLTTRNLDILITQDTRLHSVIRTSAVIDFRKDVPAAEKLAPISVLRRFSG